MTDSQELIQDSVMSTVERIENDIDDPFEQLDPLEVKVEADIDGSVNEIIAVLSTGGPHIEVALYSGRVDGYWGGDEHSAPIMDEDAENLLIELADYYLDHWEDNVLA